jgi:hypothetical protein
MKLFVTFLALFIAFRSVEALADECVCAAYLPCTESGEVDFGVVKPGDGCFNECFRQYKRQCERFSKIPETSPQLTCEGEKAEIKALQLDNRRLRTLLQQARKAAKRKK